MAVVASNQYALAAATQGTNSGGNGSWAVTTPIKRYRQVAGDVSLNPDYGSEAFSNLTKFSDRADYVNSILGQGDPGIQAQPDKLGHICHLYFGQYAQSGGGFSTATTSSIVYGVHRYLALDATRRYSTWFKQVGKDTGVTLRQKFADCVIGQLSIEGSTANKVVRVTPTVLSLYPGIIFSTDFFGGASPTVPLDTEAPFLYTEGAGQYQFAGKGTAISVIRGATQFNITFNDNLQPYFGDDINPFELFPGDSEVTLQTTLAVNDTGLNEYFNMIYGNTVVNAGDTPTRTIPTNGAYQVKLSRAVAGTTGYRELYINCPAVRWNPEAPIAANPSGGPVELALAGGARLLDSSTSTVEVKISNGLTAAGGYATAGAA